MVTQELSRMEPTSSQSICSYPILPSPPRTPRLFCKLLSLLTFGFLSLLFHAEKKLSPDLYPAGSSSSFRCQLGWGTLRKALPACPVKGGWTVLSLLFIHFIIVYGLVLLVFTVVLHLQSPYLPTISFARFCVPSPGRPASRQQRSHLLLFTKGGLVLGP